MCGEERDIAEIDFYDSEIPPRVRRRVPVRNGHQRPRGNTSACAEKSTHQSVKWLQQTEIPPRVRRRVQPHAGDNIANGNTSACAEKRHQHARSHQSEWKYLRVCGEEWSTSVGMPVAGEIPPRVRRRAVPERLELVADGNTSACAEKRLLELVI